MGYKSPEMGAKVSCPRVLLPQNWCATGISRQDACGPRASADTPLTCSLKQPQIAPCLFDIAAENGS
jgi:hypothetical protein